MSAPAGQDSNSPPSSSRSSRSASPATSRISTKSYGSSSVHPLEDEVNPSKIYAATLPASEAKSTYSVNYKPRQRPASTGTTSTLPAFSQATTSTSATSTVSVPASPGSPSKATSKLQIQSLQATLQAAGLTQESAGWNMVHKLVSEIDKKPEWELILAALKSGKASLLLPKEAAASSEIDPKFFRDHTLLRDGKNMVIMSGVRATKGDSALIFHSCVPGLDFKQMNSPEAAFADLLSSAPPANSGDAVGPRILIDGDIEIQIPRRVPNSSSAPKVTRTAPRRSLVSLFGGHRPSSAPSPPPITSTGDVLTVNESEGLVLASSPSDIPLPSSVLLVSAYTIDKIINGKRLAKAVRQSIEDRTKAVLNPEDSKVAEMTAQFLHRFHPSSRIFGHSFQSSQDIANKDGSQGSLVNVDIDVVTTAMQEFLYDVRLRLEQAGHEQAALTEALKEDTLEEKELKPSSPGDIDIALEKVEKHVCETLYDKIFSPASSADQYNDENLSTRIAGLHMLDLTLDHLGLQTEAISGSTAEWEDSMRVMREGLEDIVAHCVIEFQKLQDSHCRSPLAKLEVLIQVHKMIANGLEQLPPIPNKNNDNKEDINASDTVSYELSDEARSIGNRPSRPAGDAESQEDVEESELEETPRIPSIHAAPPPRSPIPASDVLEATKRDPYGIATTGTFTDDTIDRTDISFPDTRSTHNAVSVAVAADHATSSTSADAILPLLIYSVVQANPSKLVSHVHFIQRFRADSLMRGEGEYCLTNMDAVQSFLMSCDIGSLGLGTDKIIARQYSPATPVRIRYRAGQQLDNMVGSAGKVLGQAADFGLGGYRMLGGLLARTAPFDLSQQPKTIEEVQNVLAGTSTKASSFKDSILRRSTLSSVVQSKNLESTENKEVEMADVHPDSLSDPGEEAESTDQTVRENLPEPPLMPLVSTAASISSRLAALPGLSRLGQANISDASDRPQPAVNSISASVPAKGGLFSAFASSPLLASLSGTSSTSQESVNVATAINQPPRATLPIFVPREPPPDTDSPLLSPASVRGFSSPIAQTSGGRDRSTSFMSHSQHHDFLKTRNGNDSIPSRISPVMSPTMIAPLTSTNTGAKQVSSPSISSTTSSGFAPPIQRFLDCEADDLKVSEVACLLDDYKRLAAALAGRAALQ